MYKHKEKKPQLPSPGLQYMNIYSNSRPRLSCFAAIGTDSCEESNDYLHSNASSYEAYLESLIKKTPYTHSHQEFKESLAEPTSQPITYSYMPETQVMEYQTFFHAPIDPVSKIYYTIKRKQLISEVKSNLKVESSSFKPTFLPRV